MPSRVRLAGAVVLALVALASVSHAQAPDTTTTHARTGYLPGRGSVGGQIGGLWLLSGNDFAPGAQPRFSFIGHFRYVISRSWRWQVSPYLGWNSYRTGSAAPYRDLNFPADPPVKDRYLTLIAGAGSEIQCVLGRGRTLWHVGVGPAVYRLLVENQRRILKDPASLELHRDTFLGATGEVGVERFLKTLNNTSVEATVGWQAVFAKDDTKFPSGWSADPMGVELRIGAHYYYDLRREKKTEERPALPGLPR